ncbi:MAG: P-II family nitrogen regulator [Xenococcaceae cyanobacterium]
MKKIEAIIRPEQFNLVEHALVDFGIASMTVSHIYGSDRSEGYLKSYRGIKFVTKLLPTIKLEIVVENSLVDSIVAIILDAARMGEIGDGKIFITPVFETICIQTGEKNEHAIEPARLASAGTGV